MAGSALRLGEEVVTPVARGTIIDVRATPSGEWIFGVEDTQGEVKYFTSKALRPAQN